MPLSRTAIFVTLLIVGFSPKLAARLHPGEWLSIKREEFCVTSGAIDKVKDDRLQVDVPEMRAYVMTPTADSAEIRFRYNGPTNEKFRLGSGQVRTQFGLKLRSQDPCNLVYAIWRVEPKSELVVSVKRNPSQHSSAECHNRGYTNIAPMRKPSPLPNLRAGERHTLRAEMRNSGLRVFADTREVWVGDVGDAATLRGPLGIRSDNAKLDFEYLARRPAGNASDHMSACTVGKSD